MVPWSPGDRDEEEADDLADEHAKLVGKGGAMDVLSEGGGTGGTSVCLYTVAPVV